MNKEFKNFSKVEKDTTTENKPTMTNRILPKRDFQKVIEHDKIYLATLQEILEFALIKQDVLSKLAESILAEQTKESLGKIENISTLLDWSECKLKCLDIKAKIVTQEKLLTDKDNHFTKVFLPQWEKEVKETKSNFNSIEKKARELVKNKPKASEEVVSKIIDELYWFDKLKEDQKKDIEYKWQLYKPLKRLITAYEKVVLKKETVINE